MKKAGRFGACVDACAFAALCAFALWSGPVCGGEWRPEMEVLISNGDASAVEEFCRTRPEAVSAIRPGSALGGAESTNALQLAIRTSTPEVVDVLIRNGAPLGWKGRDPRVFLKNRANRALQEQARIRRILTEKSDADALDVERRLAERLAKTRLGPEANRRIARDQAMLKHLIPIYDEYFKKIAKNPVWKMLKRRDAAALEKWLEDGGDKNLARAHEETLLATAYRNLDAASVRVLLERGAAIGNQRLATNGREIAKELRPGVLHHRLSDPRNRSQINVRGKDGESPFTRAVLRGLTTEELQVWLENGADPNARDAQGRPIEECVGAKKREKQRMRAQRDCKEYLERRMSGEDVRPEWKDEGRAYRIPDKRRKGIPTDPAVSELKKRWKLRYDAKPMSYRELCDERRKIWEEFLRRHPEFRLDSRGEDGETLLNAAIRAYDYRATELLLSLGADPRVTDADGSCPAEAMIECARLYDEARRIDGSASQITLLCAIFSIASRMTEEEIERDLKPLRPLLESEAKRRELLLGLLAKTTSLNAIRELLNGGYLSPDYKDAQGRTLDRIIASDLQEEDYILSAMKRILENCR